MHSPLPKEWHPKVLPMFPVQKKTVHQLQDGTTIMVRKGPKHEQPPCSHFIIVGRQSPI